MSISLSRAAREAPTAEALCFEGVSMSFAEAASRASSMVGELEKRGVAVGSLVTIQASNHPAMALLMLGLLERGVCFTPVHPRLTEREVRALVEDARPAVHLDQASLLELYANSAPRALAPAPALDPERPAAMLYTSGTTGRPKAALLPGRALLASAQGSEQNLPWSGDDRWVLCLPVCHIGGLSVLTRSLLARRPVDLLSRFDEGEVLARVKQGATRLSVVPTMLRALLDADRDNTLARLRFVLVGGAATPAPLLDECAERGVLALTTYGLTEACSQVTTQRLRPASTREKGCGLPLGQMRVRIVRDDGAPAARGEVGQIVLEGPQLMLGYRGHEPLSGSPFATGDLGELDDQGLLHVHSRRTDLIVTGGENVYPAEVEGVLSAYPGVVACAVCPVDDERWGQTVAALVVARGPLDVEALTAWLRQRLSAFKVPRRFVQVDALPLTASGKVDRRAAARRASEL